MKSLNVTLISFETSGVLLPAAALDYSLITTVAIADLLTSATRPS